MSWSVCVYERIAAREHFDDDDAGSRKGIAAVAVRSPDLLGLVDSQVYYFN